MQVVQSVATGKPSSYHFLHLSVQELLAALHISKLPPPEQVRIFIKLFGQPRFDAVFRFYASFTKLQTEGIRDIITQMLSRKGEKHRLVNLLHCLYEAQHTSLCYFVSSHLESKLALERMTLNTLDLLSLRYFLSCVNSSSAEGSATISEVSLKDCGLSSQGIDSLSLCNLLKLELSRNRVSSACAANILQNNLNLKRLHLSSCSLTDIGLELFTAALREHRSLEVLILRDCTDSRHVTHQILEAVLNHRIIKHLNLAQCPLDIKDVATVLEVNDSLRVLGIGSSEIPGSDSAILAHSLRKNKTLETLVVWLKSLPGWIEEFVWTLRDCRLKTLRMVGIQEIRRSSLPIDRVNAIRKDRHLPLLKVEYSP